MIYAKTFYRKYCYHTCKRAERLVRTTLFALLRCVIPKFNSYRLFGLPSGWKDVQSEEVIPDQMFTFSAPSTIELQSHPHFDVRQFEERGGRVAFLPGGIQTNAAATLTRDGYLARGFTEQFTMKGEHGHKLFTFRSERCFAKIPHYEGQVVSLVAECPTNYYHWLFDALPKIHLVRKAGVGEARYYADTSCAFQRATLAALGIEDVIPAQEVPVLSAEMLVVTTFPAQRGIPRWVLAFLRQHFPPGEPRRRFYISRGDATMRRVVNEEAFAPLLEAHGFERVVPGELTFEEQVACFRDAEVIVAPHGAGLANLAFAPASAKVIEIYSPRSTCVCYWMLADMLGMEYHYLRGVDDPALHATTEPAHDDILVDPDKLKQAFERVLGA